MVRVGAVQDVLCIGHDPAPILRVSAWESNDVIARYLEQAEHQGQAFASEMGRCHHVSKRYSLQSEMRPGAGQGIRSFHLLALDEPVSVQFAAGPNWICLWPERLLALAHAARQRPRPIWNIPLR